MPRCDGPLLSSRAPWGVGSGWLTFPPSPGVASAAGGLPTARVELARGGSSDGHATRPSGPTGPGSSDTCGNSDANRTHPTQISG